MDLSFHKRHLSSNNDPYSESGSEKMEANEVVEERRKQMEKKDVQKWKLPDADDVISEWFSQDHPNRLRKTCWRDHSQYREYHKTL